AKTATISPAPPSVQPANSPAAQQVQSGLHTLSDLVRAYQTDERSPYQTARYATRMNYKSLVKRIADDHGEKKLTDLKAQHIQDFYEGWTASGMAVARARVTMLRMLFAFGMKTLEDTQCERLSVVLRHMRFKMGERRTERLTVDHVIGIRAKAHDLHIPM